MTICYGSTRYSCTDFVIEDLTKRQDKGEHHYKWCIIHGKKLQDYTEIPSYP